jgi:hypothetical protein
MSAVRKLEAESGPPEDDEEEPGLWESFGTALRLIVGWFCVAIGVLNLLVEADRNTGDPDLPYFVFHCMLFAGGLVLLSLNWLVERHDPVASVAGGIVAAAGLVITGAPVTNTVCCMYAFPVRHGWPFTFVARDESRWHVDSQHLLADLLFWGYAGLIVLVVVALARRGTHRSDGADHPAQGAAPHAEPRAMDQASQRDDAAT